MRLLQACCCTRRSRRTRAPRPQLAIIDFGLALEAAHEAERRSSLLAQGRNPELPPLGAAPQVSDPARDGYFYGTPAYASRRAIAMLPLSYRDGASCVRRNARLSTHAVLTR